jgi:enoyl-CoA hydratase
MAEASSEAEVIVETRGSAGRIRLNRPQALNSMSLAMLRRTVAAVDRFERDPAIASIIITGEGGRAFCAGGDVRQIYDSLAEGPGLADTFWREEYAFNARIAALPKPYIAIMDGITMGGGVGLSAHGSHRIVTERTRIAMPEAGIGFFPDVGGSWLLSRSDGELGTWLGLTGEAVGPADAIRARLADAYVPSGAVAGLIEAVAALPAAAAAAEASAVVARFAEPAEGGTGAAERAEIAAAFAHDTVEAILAALAASGSAFGARTRDTLLAKSPTSLKVTLRLLRLGRGSRSLGECLEREYAACQEILAAADFREGIRAAVIDKDRNPHWSPATLAEVGDAAVDRYFGPAPAPLFRN